MEAMLHVHGHECQDDAETCRQRCIDVLVLAEWWSVTQEFDDEEYRSRECGTMEWSPFLSFNLKMVWSLQIDCSLTRRIRVYLYYSGG